MAQNVRSIAPKLKEKSKKEIKSGILDSLLTILVSILIVLVIFGGAFYYLLKNDIGGLGEYFRPSIERIPVLKLALPPLPETEDPYDPKHLTQKELLTKYNELRAINRELTEQLEDANKRIADLEAEKSRWSSMAREGQVILEKNEETLKQVIEKMEQLDNDRKEFDRLVAMGDEGAFARYYEKVDPENAKELYSEIVQKEAVKENYKDLAKSYTEMEPANAAAILTELGREDMELVVNLIEAMKNNEKAEIIENMDPRFAAELMKSIADRKFAE
ncbi:MAG: hypothetical protein GXZ01_08460 [Clostridiaceae bacterium]|jgi:flagellar motility protein MotE (MotC chaperone)|nr:hypothetical protein [Clostridiaceae bacterium]